MNKINEILLNDFKTIPFHNFWMILNERPILELGGTCSDKTIFLKEKLREKGFKTRLHSARINGKSIHRLLKININKRDYLLDVGLGWPIIEPIPLFEETSFKFYGVEFKTKIKNEILTLIRVKKEDCVVNYRTSIKNISEIKINNEIKCRFENIKVYPFNQTIRFSKVVDNKFYFLKGCILKYSSNNNQLIEKKIKNIDDYKYLFTEIFNFDYKLALKVANKLSIFNKRGEVCVKNC